MTTPRNLKNIFSLLMGFIIFALCTSPEEQSAKNTGIGIKNLSGRHCYRYQTENDTISMKVTVENNLVAGTLDYFLK